MWLRELLYSKNTGRKTGSYPTNITEYGLFCMSYYINRTNCSLFLLENVKKNKDSKK